MGPKYLHIQGKEKREIKEIGVPHKNLGPVFLQYVPLRTVYQNISTL
jgi:hypothetical protein